MTYNIYFKIKYIFLVFLLILEFTTSMKDDQIVYQTIYDMILLHIIVYDIYMIYIGHSDIMIIYRRTRTFIHENRFTHASVKTRIVLAFSIIDFCFELTVLSCPLIGT